MSSYGANMEKLYMIVSQLHEQYPNADRETLRGLFKKELVRHPNHRELREAVIMWGFKKMIHEDREKPRHKRAKSQRKR